MADAPPPDDDLTPPGPPVEGAAEDSTPRTGGLGVDEWLAANRSAPRAAIDPYASPRSASRPPASKKMAGWALALSLAFCIPFAFLVAFGLAIAVLVKGRDGRDNGKGMAIAALVISSLVVVANIVYVAVVVVDMWRNGWDETVRDPEGTVTEGGLVSIDRLRDGDCISDFTSEEEVEAGEWDTGEATVVPCAEPHRSEVFEIFSIDVADYTSQSSLDDAAVQGCLEPYRRYVGRSYFRSEHELHFYSPSVEGGSARDDSVICLVTSTSGPTTTMLEGSRS